MWPTKNTPFACKCKYNEVISFRFGPFVPWAEQSLWRPKLSWAGVVVVFSTCHYFVYVYEWLGTFIPLFMNLLEYYNLEIHFSSLVSECQKCRKKGGVEEKFKRKGLRNHRGKSSLYVLFPSINFVFSPFQVS